MQNNSEFSESFLEDIKKLNLSILTKQKVLKLVDSYCNKNEDDSNVSIPYLVKMIINTMKFANKERLSNISDKFLFQLMDLDLEKKHLYNLIDVINSHYHNKDTKSLKIR